MGSGNPRRSPTRLIISSRMADVVRMSYASSTALGLRPSLCRPGHRGSRLIGVNPGSREYLRASVDYDGIPEKRNGLLQPGPATGALGRLRADRRPGNLPPRLGARQPPTASSPTSCWSRISRRVQGPVPVQRPDARPGRKPLGDRLCGLQSGWRRWRAPDRLRRHRLRDRETRACSR